MDFGRGKSKKGDVARNTYSWPQHYKGENVMYKLPTNVYKCMQNVFYFYTLYIHLYAWACAFTEYAFFTKW